MKRTVKVRVVFHGGIEAFVVAPWRMPIYGKATSRPATLTYTDARPARNAKEKR